MGLAKIRLSFLEMVTMSFLTTMVNYLGPASPGAAAKGLYLKVSHQLPFSQFAAVLAVNSFIVMLTTGTVAHLLLLILWFKEGIFSPGLTLAATIIVLIGIAPWLIPLPTLLHNGRIASIYNRALHGFKTIHSQHAKIAAVCASLLVQFAVSGTLMWTIFTTLGSPISPLSAVIIGVFTAMANFFSITPSNFGIQELVIAYLSTTTGTDFNTGLLGAALLRAIHLTLTFGVTPFLLFFTLKRAGLALNQIIPKPSQS